MADNAELLAAVSAAVDTASNTTPQETVNETPDDDALETGGEGDTSLDEGAEGAGEGGDADDAGGADETGGADAAKLGPDGKPLAAKPVLGADGKPVDEAAAKAAAAAAKPKDPLNDPIAPQLKEQTRERITALIDIAKTVTAERDLVKGQFEEVMGLITETRATPEQYGQTLDYLRMVNSGDPAQLERAFSVMQAEMAALGRMLGKDVPGVDVLANHPDIKAEVTAGKMTQEAAKELALHRDRARVASENSTAARGEQQRLEAHNRVVTEGRNALTKLGNELRAADPATYARKAAILTKSLKGTFAEIDPRKWASAFKIAYDNLELPAAPKAVVKSNVPKNQPLRGGNPAGGQQKSPGSMAEAIDFALAQAGQ